MRRVAIALLAVGLAAAGLFAAVVLAGTPAGAVDTTTSTTDTTATTDTATLPPTTAPPTTTVAPTTTTVATTATTATTTTTPKPKPPPPPPPKPAPKPVRLAAGVTIGGIHVGGLGPDAAYQVVRLAWERPRVLLVRSDQLFQINASPEALGAVAYVKAAVRAAVHVAPHTAVPLRVVVHGQLVRSYVQLVGQRLDRKPVDVSVVLRNLKPRVTKPVSGWQLDEQAAARKIVAALLTNRRAPVRLRLKELKPKLADDKLPIVVIQRGSNVLTLYDGEKQARVFHVATGQSAYPTPLGRFQIVVKWENPWWYPPDSPWAKGAKPIPPGPGNPLGTRWMGLSAPGVGIHGTPDAASIGYSLSHGCIRMLISEAEWLFNHVNVGTPVFIVDT